MKAIVPLLMAALAVAQYRNDIGYAEQVGYGEEEASYGEEATGYGEESEETEESSGYGASGEESGYGVTQWESSASSEAYIAKLNADTDGFVTSLAQWVSDSTGVNFAVDSSFTLHTEGQEWSESCGDLSVHSAFKVLESFIENPKNAKKDIKQAAPLEWKPSKDCVKKHEYLFLDGGAHAEFKVYCGKEILVEAIAGGGGFYVPLCSGKSEYVGGALASVEIEHEIEVAGEVHAGKHLKTGLTKDRNHNAFKVLADLKETTQVCANNGTLNVVGVAGGGWTQKYRKDGDIITSVVGYAESFSIIPENADESQIGGYGYGTEEPSEAPTPVPSSSEPLAEPTPAVTVPEIVATPEPTEGEPDYGYGEETDSPTTTPVVVDKLVDNNTTNTTTEDVIVAPAHTPAVTVPAEVATPEPTQVEGDYDETEVPTTTIPVDNLVDNNTTNTTTDDVIVAPAPTPAATVPTEVATPEPTEGEPDYGYGEETDAPTTTIAVDNLVDNNTTNTTNTPIDDVIVAPPTPAVTVPEEVAIPEPTEGDADYGYGEETEAPTTTIAVDNLVDTNSTNTTTDDVIVAPPTPAVTIPEEVATPGPTQGEVDYEEPTTTLPVDNLVDTNTTNTTIDDVIVAPPTPAVTVPDATSTPEPTEGAVDYGYGEETDVPTTLAVDNLVDNNTTNTTTDDVIVSPAPTPAVTVPEAATPAPTQGEADYSDEPTTLAVDNLVDNNTTNTTSGDVIVAPPTPAVSVPDAASTPEPTEGSSDYGYSNETEVPTDAPTTLAVDNLVDTNTTNPTSTDDIALPTPAPSEPEDATTPEPTTAAGDYGYENVTDAPTDNLVDANSTANATDAIVSLPDAGYGEETTESGYSEETSDAGYGVDANATNTTEGAIDVTSSLVALSRRVSKSYLDAGIECAAMNPSSVCQSKRLASKLHLQLQRISYASIDMTSVYNPSSSTGKWSLTFETSAASLVMAACVILFVTIRTQRRRAGYVGIPQSSDARPAQAGLNWPWYSGH
ncbi:hypothetical protein AC1031_018242 [Aphanomyces cochlioides]|nr:hypothetical protein AC1031_018242 [Aphanomyces cochlioides]